MSSSLALARTGSQVILGARERYRAEFLRITARAREHFDRRDWAGAQRDAQARLDLYRLTIIEVVAELQRVLSGELLDLALWKALKASYSDATVDLADEELAETFFNSVTRKVFTTLGVDPALEFVDLDPRRDRYGLGSTVHRHFAVQSSLAQTLVELLQSYSDATALADVERDARLAAARIEAHLEADLEASEVTSIDALEPIFYRGNGAYLVGRMRTRARTLPLVLILVHEEDSGCLRVDAVLSTERDVSILFSYTRSHFLVDAKRPADVVRFLATLMPRKPLAELYISLGFVKHGKTELYRGLMGHLSRSLDRFDHAPGDVGMVMICFTLKSYDYVFKVIRDEFAPPKTNTRADVLERYELVFRHDRAGRLIEAQEFEHLVFERRRFSDALLEELTRAASATVSVVGDEVHLAHVYIERRVHPLNLFLRDFKGEITDRTVLDYGQAIRDLATTNIFPGDMLLKNFGVTRHGRVTFYDYDELCLVTDCHFRDLPVARDDEEELAAEPWFYVGQDDVFPEEFLHFMGLNSHHRELFVEHHGDVLDPSFWRGLRERHANGEVIHVFPYDRSKRLER